MSGGRPKGDYTICPDCKRKTVLFKYGAGGADYYECTYARFPVAKDGHVTADICSWSVFADPEPGDEVAQHDLQAWKDLNP